MGSFSGTAGGLAAGNTSTTGTTPLAHTFNDQQLRHVMIDGEPWFVLMDLCAILGLRNSTEAARSLDADERRRFSRTELGLPNGSPMQAVSEPALYALIARSKRPEARKFDRWVRHEVLPSIRKTGSYNMADHGREQMPLPAEIAQLFQQMTAMMERMVETQAAQCGPAANPQK